MTNYRNLLFPSLVDDGKVSVTRKSVIYLDAIGSALLQIIHCFSTFVGIGNHNCRTMSSRIRAIQDWATSYNSRSEQLSGRNLRTPFEQLFKVAANIANSNDAVGNEHRERTRNLSEVHVHVPQPRNEKKSLSVDDLGGARYANLVAGSNLFDAVPLNHDSHVGVWRSTSHINDSYVSDNEEV